MWVLTWPQRNIFHAELEHRSFQVSPSDRAQISIRLNSPLFSTRSTSTFSSISVLVWPTSGMLTWDRIGSLSWTCCETDGGGEVEVLAWSRSWLVCWTSWKELSWVAVQYRVKTPDKYMTSLREETHRTVWKSQSETFQNAVKSKWWWLIKTRLNSLKANKISKRILSSAGEKWL